MLVSPRPSHRIITSPELPFLFVIQPISWFFFFFLPKTSYVMTIRTRPTRRSWTASLKGSLNSAADQGFHAILSKANITLQLYPRERFAVKLSEALHKSKPVIATMVRVIPLEVQHGKYGFSVNVGESNAVANHLYDLCTDSDLYNRMNH